MKKLNSQFAHLRLEDYLRQYTDRSASCRVRQPDKEELENIFNSMLKHTEASRKIDCECCDYETCEKMAIAISGCRQIWQRVIHTRCHIFAL
ncbi:MAG: hypothetical protein MR949_03585 [Veillonellaceae bacterium]|nr:hypothetical protein [Veillonellaceae bacterium]